MVLTQIVRWADNTADLKRNLAQGLDMIESTKASAEKMVQALRGDKLIESAHKMTAAIGLLQRGVSELSPQEAASKLALLERAMDKMERTGRPIPAQMRATADALKQVSTVVTPLSARFQALGQDVLKSAAGFATGLLTVAAFQNGLRMVTDFVISSAKSFLDAEKANAKLDASLRATGQFTPRLSSHYRALAEEMQRLTVHSDDLNAEAISLFVSLGRVGPAQMERALKAAADLSAGLGKDLLTSTELLSKAFQGKITTLQRYGIAVESSTDKGRQFENVLAAINSRFGGQAEAAAQTNIGRIEQLGNAWDNLKEIIGGAIVLSPKFQQFLMVTNQLLAQQGNAAGTAAIKVQGLVTAYDEYLARAMMRGLPLMKPGAQKDINLPMEIPADYVQQLANVRGEIGRLTADQRKQLDAASTLGEGMEELARRYGLSEDATRLYSVVTKDAAKSTRELNEAAEKARQTQDRLWGLDVIERTRAMTEQIGELTNVSMFLPEIQAEILASVEKSIAVYERWGTSAPQALLKVRDALRPLVAANDLAAGVETNINAITFRLGQLAAKVNLFPHLKTAPFDPSKLPGTRVNLVPPTFGQQLAGQLGDSLRSFGSQLGQTVLNALTGGGSVGRSVGALAGQSIGQALSASLTGMLTRTLGKTLGPALANILPGIGAVLGSMLGGVIGWLFGPSWRDQIRAFADEFAGGMDQLREKMRALGAEGEQLWDRLNGSGHRGKSQTDALQAIEDTKAAFDRLTQRQAEATKHFDQLSSAAVRFGGVAPRALHGLIDKLLQAAGLTEDMRAALEALKGTPGIDALREAAERYGKTLDDLGQNLSQLGSNDAFDRLFSDWTLFMDAGADGNAVFDAMQDKINEAVNRARKLGLAIPEFMRPLLLQMLEAGRLTDEFGNKLTSLDGITFSASIESSLSRIAEIFERIAKLMEDAVRVTEPLRQAPPGSPEERFAGPRSPAGQQMTVNVVMEGQTVARAVMPFIPDEVLTMRLA